MSHLERAARADNPARASQAASGAAGWSPRCASGRPPCAAASCVSPNSSIRRCSPCASSSGFKSSRWMFSISASASACVVGHRLHQRRNLAQPRALRRAPAPLAGDDLEAAAVDRPHEDRLHHALLADRLGELGERRVVHARARLVLARTHAVDRDRLQRVVAGAGSSVPPRKQRVESAAKSLRVGSSSRPSSVRRPARRSSTAVARLLAAQHLAREREIGERALDCGSSFSAGMPCDGASARRMLRGTIVRIELVAEMPLELGGDVLRERVARVVHRAQQALDLEPRDSGARALSSPSARGRTSPSSA